MEKLKNYQKNVSVVCTELDEEAILLNLDTKYYYNLNETGLRIWQILDELDNPKLIAERLSAEYEVDQEGAETGVIKLIAELEKEGLVILK